MEDNLPNHPIEDDIYIGFWINRSLSGFRAATITLDQRQGNMLVSFVAMFVGATARSIWKLVRFTLHHWYSVPTTKDGVHNQRQAVLRNTSLATDAAVQFLEIRHVWRHRTREGTARALALFAVALMISVATTAAGILSSKILIKSSNIALIANPNCTQPLVSNFSAANGNAYWRARYAKYNAQKMAEDLSYATQCYTNEGEHECERFVQPYLPYTPDYNASCPFASKVCNSTFGNLILDSGELDSIQQLGLNDGPRFSLRYRTHCALLNVTDYTALYTSPPDSGRRYLVYKFGTANQSPWVHAVEQLRKNETTTDFFPGTTGFDNYKIIPYYSIAGGTKFIPELMQAHIFVSLTFLESDGVLYNSDNHDPWFSNASGKRASVLGCAVERLLCNPALPSQIGCINTLVADPSTDEFHTSFDNAWPHLDDKHKMWPIFIAQGGYQRGLPDTLYRFKAASALLARITLENNKQTAEIPSNQWQKEREHIYKATLAGIQSGLVDFARGYWWGSPRCQDDFVCLQSCYSQRVRSASSKFYSFRAWALFTLLVTGVAIMIVSLFIEEIFDALLRLPCLRRNKRLTYGQAEWQAGSTLQLQRIAHENLGLGTWKRTDEAVPVTNLDETLGVFDISNRKHARLVKPSTEMNDLEDVENSGKVSGARDKVQYLRLPSNETLWSPRSPVSDKLWSPRSPSNEQLWSP